MEKKAFKLEAAKKPKKSSSASSVSKVEKKPKQASTEKVAKEEVAKEQPVAVPEKPKKLTKKRLAAMTPEQAAEVTAAAVEARRQARLEKRMQRKAEQEDLNSSLARPRDLSNDGWKVEDTVFNCEAGWIVVLTPKGELYQEPVSRYCDLPSFLATVCSLPCISTDSHLRLEAIISKTPFEYGEIITAAYLGVSPRNNFASCFDLQTEPKTASGNIVFSGKDSTSLTLGQAKEVTKWVIEQLEKEEEIDVS